MNEIPLKTNQDFLNYQALRLQELMNEMVQCCDDRKLYESERFHAPYAELMCLMLFNGQRYLTVKDLAGKLDVAKSRITKIVDGLVQKGFVERIEDPKDARVKLIGLTPAGKKASREFDDFHKKIHRSILLQISPDERKNTLSHLEMPRSAMEAVKEQLK